MTENTMTGNVIMQVVCRLSELRDGSITKARTGDADIVIVRDGTLVRAFAANCPHAGAPLAEGKVCDHRLVCPWHKATFRIRDYVVLEPPALAGSKWWGPRSLNRSTITPGRDSAPPERRPRQYSSFLSPI